MRLFIAFGVLTAMVALSGVAKAQELMPGDVAPPFELVGSDGKTHRLADYAGTTVILAWFPKAFTGGWTAECKSLSESSDQLSQFNIAYFMVSVDDPDTNKKFAESLDAKFPLLSNPEKDVAKAYGVFNEEREFAFRWTYIIGPDGTVLGVDKDVTPATAGVDLVALLSELGVAKR
jgi:peroxiredoxin Q/BCP